jgi:hypothetical protein
LAGTKKRESALDLLQVHWAAIRAQKRWNQLWRGPETV